MKITIISDLHNKYNRIELSGGDLIICCGDVSSMGYSGEIEIFLNWFNKTNYRYKVFIAGNHDFYFDYSREAYTRQGAQRWKNPQYTEEDVSKLLSQYPDIIYLNDSGCEIEGIKIWGSPITPWFHDWAFNRLRGEDIKTHWDMIPEDTDILITHGPPKGILDQVGDNYESQGCEHLWNRVLEVNPIIHCFGHIHEGYGAKEFHGINFINASALNHRNVYQNKAIDLILEDNIVDFI